MQDHFEIIFTPYKLHKRYRMQVEVLHRSDQVIRFKISGGDNFMIMEKHLHKQTGAWKLCDTNFSLAHQPVEQTACTIIEIQNRLDAWLKRDVEVTKWER